MEPGNTLAQRMLEAQNWYYERAVHPETHLIYADIDLTDPYRWENTIFPAPESIRNRFGDDGERFNVSDCAMSNGVFLGVLVDGYEVTRAPECIDQARVVFDGMRTLAQVSPRKGFIARGVLPGDTQAHLLNSSVDQYTLYVYGLWKYYHSPMAGEQERQRIRAIMTDICTMIERDGTILSTDGIPAPVSDIETIRSDRSSRLLEMYMVAYDVTTEAHWLDKYRGKARESRFARIRSLLDPERVQYPYLPRDRYIHLICYKCMWQTQCSLVPLFEVETDITLKAAYLEAIRLNAQLCELKAATGYQEMEVILLAQNRALVDPYVRTSASQRYQQLLRQRCTALLESNWIPRQRCIAGLYWTGVRRGIFPRPAL